MKTESKSFDCCENGRRNHPRTSSLNSQGDERAPRIQLVAQNGEIFGIIWMPAKGVAVKRRAKSATDL